MLPSTHRLQKRKDIEHVLRRGRTTHNGPISIRAAKNNLEISRFTVVVSLKVSKKAVRRNLLKRRIREIVRRELLATVAPGIDGIIITKKELLNDTFFTLQKRVHTLFKKARLV